MGFLPGLAYTAERPLIELTADAGKPVLSWPADAEGYVLDMASYLSPQTNNWTTHNVTAVSVNTKQQAVLSGIVDRAFYRLRDSRFRFERVNGPLTLNGFGRGLFANVMIYSNEVTATYQVAPVDSFREKHLYYQVFNRNLSPVEGEQRAIDVNANTYYNWGGDLGDHKFTMMDDKIYMVFLPVDGSEAKLLKYTRDFTHLLGPRNIGLTSPVERPADMGFAADGMNIYPQFFYQPTTNPEDWGASLYQVNSQLVEMKHVNVEPDAGSFSTGSALDFIPAGGMGSTDDRMQIIGTNTRDLTFTGLHSIHTFGVRVNLQPIPGSQREIISGSHGFQVYFPTGASWNEAHDLMVVGYTMEANPTNFPGAELGPSFFRVFDRDWQVLDTVPLNQGQVAMRVIVQTQGNDIYVVYDEMEKDPVQSPASRARIEHYRISSLPPDDP